MCVLLTWLSLLSYGNNNGEALHTGNEIVYLTVCKSYPVSRLEKLILFLANAATFWHKCCGTLT